MKWLIVVLVILIAGAILGPISSGNAGYVLVQFAGWSMETSVIALILITLVTVLLISVVVALIKSLVGRGKAGGQWFSKRRDLKAAEWLQQGQVALLEQDYQAALKAFEAAYKKQASAVIAAMASYAAQRTGEAGKSEFWRSEAGERFEQADRVLQLQHIRSLATRDANAASQELGAWLKQHPHDEEGWQLAIRLAPEANAWQFLADNLTYVDKYADNAEQFKQTIYFQLFLLRGRQGNDTLYDYWRSLNRSQRGEAFIRLAYARALKHLGQREACAKVVYKGLKRGELGIEEATDANVLCAADEKLLAFVQETLKRNPEHNGFIRALAILAIDSKDYSLAQRALKKLVEKQPNPRDYKYLGDVYNALGDSQLAANAYQKALA